MKKTIIINSMLFLVFLNTFAQDPCQITKTTYQTLIAIHQCQGRSIDSNDQAYNVNGTNVSIINSLPTGLTGNLSGGVYTISGIPQSVGSFNYTITTSGGCTGGASILGGITIEANQPTTLTSVLGTDNQTVCKGNAISDITYNYQTQQVSVSGLPAGVSYNAVYSANSSSVLTISGTPTVTGLFNYTVMPFMGCGEYVTGTISVTDQKPVVNILSSNPNVTNPCNGYLEVVSTNSSSLSYMWVGDNGNTANHRTALCAGTYSVVVTDNTTGCFDSLSTTLVAESTPVAITNPLSIDVQTVSASDANSCDGSAIINITGASTPYTTSFASSIYTTNTISVNNLCPGFYTVNSHDNTASPNEQSKAFTFVIGSPNTLFISIAASNTVTPVEGVLVASAVSNCDIDYDNLNNIEVTNSDMLSDSTLSVTWTISFTNSNPPINVYSSYYPTASGIYNVVLDLYCTNRTSASAKAIDQLTVSPMTGIENIDITPNVMIYPNPFTLQTTLVLNKEVNNGTVKIIDIAGKEVKTIPFSGTQIRIEKGDLKEGFYFIQIVVFDKIIANEKIIIQ